MTAEVITCAPLLNEGMAQGYRGLRTVEQRDLMRWF